MSKRSRKRSQVIGYVNVHLADGAGVTVPILRKGGVCRSNTAYGWWHDGGPVRFEIKIGKKSRWQNNKRGETA